MAHEQNSRNQLRDNFLYVHIFAIQCSPGLCVSLSPFMEETVTGGKTEFSCTGQWPTSKRSFTKPHRRVSRSRKIIIYIKKGENINKNKQNKKQRNIKLVAKIKTHSGHVRHQSHFRIIRENIFFLTYSRSLITILFFLDKFWYFDT